MTPNIVSRDKWLAQRKALLAKEKELTRLRDELARERRELPWVPVEKNYVFDGPAGKLALTDLFGERSQLVVYHFMFGPGWKQGCPSCSFVSDHFGGALAHLAARDVAFAAVSRAGYAELSAFKARMGWEFDWVSSATSDFNRDFHVSFTREEVASGEVVYNFGPISMPGEEAQEAQGLSVFCKDAAGTVYHTYSSYARGCEPLIGVYHLLDMTPKGRDEQGLPWPMAWVRHHDSYGRLTHA
jgi:predicted dithiol-disulfide oxidoreductase (DUF899 family)